MKQTMQKLNLISKETPLGIHRFAKSLLTIFVFVGVFFLGAGEALAACAASEIASIDSLTAGQKVKITDSQDCIDYCSNAYLGNSVITIPPEDEDGDKYCENSDEVSDADPTGFEVTLQSPFAESPNSEDCIETEKDVYRIDDHGYQWVCRAESTRWQQIIVGDDGNEILTDYAGMLYKWLSGFIGIAAVLMLVVGGIQISTAGANQEGLKEGKDRIIAALVGLAILFLSSLILFTINPTFFGGS
jgi:hypothetical protein